VSLAVREHISGATHAIFTNFLRMLHMAVAGSSSGRVTKSQGEEQFCMGFSSPMLDNACNAFAAKGIIPHRPGMGHGSAQRG